MNATFLQSTGIAFVLILIWNIRLCSPEMFSSTANLKHLAANERRIIDEMETYIAKEDARLNTLRQAIEGIRDAVTPTADQDPMGKAGHPVEAFNIIKRWVKLGNTNTTGISDVISSSTRSLPVDDDYMGAVKALIRLQKTYQLPTADLARGDVQGVPSSATLSSEDMLQLGKAARRAGELKFAREWFQLAHSTTENIQLEQEILLELATLHKQVGDHWTALRITQYAVDKGLENSALAAETMESLRTMIREYDASGVNPVKQVDWSAMTAPGEPLYEALCRGEKTVHNPVLESKLLCQYKRGLLPYVLYKEELLSFVPRVAMFYDVVSDAEVTSLQELGYQSLFRGQVGDPGALQVIDGRVSKLTWLWDEPENLLVNKLTRRVADITGLSTQYRPVRSSAEPFQLVNYGMGGQYEPHHDYADDIDYLERQPDFLLNTGDRIATFLFYLSDVQAGGATVFPEIGVRVPPIKNAAAFWYNLLPDGSPDPRSLHAGCPVLLGEKWVANKWFREWGQDSRRPCGFNQHDTDNVRGLTNVARA